MQEAAHRCWSHFEPEVDRARLETGAKYGYGALISLSNILKVGFKNDGAGLSQENALKINSIGYA
jgi:hypothetical protein